MAILGTNDGGVTTIEQKIADLQTQINNLTAQLPSYSTSTLEGTQAIDAINNRVNAYQQAINEYKSLISGVKNAATEAKQGSIQKQQAKQGYIGGLATKRGMTHAEALKDIADVEAIGRGERSEIRSQEQENLASAKGGLSNLYMNIAEQEAALAAANPSSGSGSGSGLSSAISSYATTPQNKTSDEVNAIMGNQEISGGASATIPQKKQTTREPSLFGNIARYIVDPTYIGRFTAMQNIFKKLNK